MAMSIELYLIFQKNPSTLFSIITVGSRVEMLVGKSSPLFYGCKENEFFYPDQTIEI